MIYARLLWAIILFFHVSLRTMIYPDVCRYIQCAVVQRFQELCTEKNGDRLKLDQCIQEHFPEYIHQGRLLHTKSLVACKRLFKIVHEVCKYNVNFETNLFYVLSLSVYWSRGSSILKKRYRYDKLEILKYNKDVVKINQFLLHRSIMHQEFGNPDKDRRIDTCCYHVKNQQDNIIGSNRLKKILPEWQDFDGFVLVDHA